jgi:hypothetical protein
LVELGADESALTAAPENRSALARAMLGFASAASGGIDLARVDHVLGEPPSWRFPARLCAAPLLAVALIVAVAILAGELAVGRATLAMPFLSSEPCVAMLALIAAGGPVVKRSLSGR